MHTLNIHNQLYEFYTWDDLGELSFELAQQILTTGKKYDRLVALSKGGLAFARSLVDFLDLPDISTIKIEFYTGINETNKTPVITQSLPVNIKNEAILIYDDIVDTGETLSLAIKYLNQHGAKSVDTAVLFLKPWTKVNSDFKGKESSAWVIFPNEIRETILTLAKIWRQLGDNQDQITAQLKQLGFKDAELALFLPPE